MCTRYWAFEEIMACMDASIVQGYPQGDYKPLLEVDRAQMAVHIAGAFGLPFYGLLAGPVRAAEERRFGGSVRWRERAAAAQRATRRP